MWITYFLIVLFFGVVIIKLNNNRHKKICPEDQKPTKEPPREIGATENNSPAAEVQAPAQENSFDAEITIPKIENSTSKKPAANKIYEIEEKIKLEIQRRQATPESLPFLVACFVLDLDPHSETLAHEFIAEVYTRLCLQDQLVGHGPHRIPEHSPIRSMLEHVLEAAYEMLLHADKNIEIVRNYMPMLLSKRRSLSSRDKYGDEDLKPWVNFSSRFAVDKLKGVDSLRFFMEFLASDNQRNTVSAQGMADIFGYFTRLAIVFLQSHTDDENDVQMTGVEYERMLQEQIENNFPAANVSMTPPTGDHGSDIIVDINGIRIAIQAKYYQSAVGNAAVQEAYSGKGFYKADFAMVVCNSTFTRHAKELSENLNVALATTENYIQIIEMLINTKKAQPMEDRRGI